jgi:hypothetical protein
MEMGCGVDGPSTLREYPFSFTYFLAVLRLRRARQHQSERSNRWFPRRIPVRIPQRVPQEIQPQLGPTEQQEVLPQRRQEERAEIGQQSGKVGQAQWPQLGPEELPQVIPRR